MQFPEHHPSRHTTCGPVRAWVPRLPVLGLAALLAACGGDGDTVASQDSKVACESLAGLSIAGGTVRSATGVAAGTYTPAGSGTPISGLPAFCRVALTMQPSSDSHIEVEVWMPRTNWNGRFLGTGNGGGAGAITYATGMVEGLKRGFAVANTDLGTAPDVNQAIDHPERWRDFGYRANHEMTVASKAMVTAYYQAAPRHAYFAGCSTGGQQALSIAQRYPEDYQGILAGAPANDRTHLHAMFASNLRTLTAPGAALSSAKLDLVTGRVLAACGGQDGGAPGDGFLTDPRRCNFDPDTLPTCPAGTDSDSCVTSTQLNALKAVWRGPVNPRTGERIFAGLPLGTENAVFGLAFQGNTTFWPAQQLYMFKWALGPSWDYATFDSDRDMDIVDARLAASLNANDANLSRFRDAGGKLMMYTGSADPGVPYASAIDYYERAVQAQGGDLTATQRFFRYYLVPGMGHCGSIAGGAGVGDFGQPYSAHVPKDAEGDVLLKLVDWVEKGKAPDSFIATRYTDATGSAVAMERPVCTYPKIPTYQGGDATKATSFVCQEAARHGVSSPADRYRN